MTKRIVSLSYDLAGRPRSLEVLEAKLRRDGRDTDDLYFLVCGLHAEHFELSSRVRGEVLRTPLSSRLLGDMLMALRAPRVLQRANFRPDEIVLADFPLVWAAFRVRQRVGGAVVLHLGSLPGQLAATRGVLHRLYFVLHERLTWRLVDRFVAINDATRNYLLRLGVPARRIEVRAPDTISPDLSLIAAAKKGAARERFGIAANERLVLTVGRLEPEKAFDELIDLFAAVPQPARLVIAGQGLLREALQARVAKKGLEGRVVFAGQQDRRRLWELYADADAFVLLSKSEALGMVVWEAMYAGVPVVGRPIGGIKESIGEDGERGFFWDTADGPEAFAKKIERCARKDADVQNMMARAKTYVEERLANVQR